MSTKPAFIQDKVEKIGETDAEDISAMAKELRKLMDDKEEHADALKKINIRLDALSGKLAEAMEAQGVDGFKVQGTGTVRIDEKHHPRVTDKEALEAWVDENGMPETMPRTMHPARLASLVKELLEDAKALPNGVEDFVQKRAVLRRS